MRGLVFGVTFAGAVLAVSGGLAQPAAPPVENVTVTGTKSHQVIESFIKSLAAPTRLTGKIARWQDGICPVADGVPRAFGRFLLQHLKDVAASAGAPVDKHSSCEANIQIVFTKNPQALLDDINKNAPDMLGYYDNDDQRTQAAQVVRPIQAWYTTETIDLRGQAHFDSPKSGGLILRISPKLPPVFIPHAIATNVTGGRLGDGLHSAFYHVLIVVSPDELKDYEMGALGDYIAMVALSQLESLDECQQLPSIVNMLAKNCSQKTETLTENDTAYLHGLYTSRPDSNLNLQEDTIAYQMEQTAKGH
jgi:hypothetical protein